MKRLPSFPPFATGMSRRKFKSMRENVDVNLCPKKPSLTIFSLLELKTSTNHFYKEKGLLLWVVLGTANLYKFTSFAHTNKIVYAYGSRLCNFFAIFLFSEIQNH
ncbi:unnamed protein product, partial [Cuscuta epithymum]